jgi:hypothetical protein
MDKTYKQASGAAPAETGARFVDCVNGVLIYSTQKGAPVQAPSIQTALLSKHSNFAHATYLNSKRVRIELLAG